MDDERALTLRQVAERCQLSYSTVFTMRRRIGFRLPGSRTRSCLPDSLFQFRSEPGTARDRQCEASRSVVDRKSISMAVSVSWEGFAISIIGTRRAAARQAEGKARGEPVGNGGTA
jgi:hypothetical protein